MFIEAKKKRTYPIVHHRPTSRSAAKHMPIHMGNEGALIRPGNPLRRLWEFDNLIPIAILLSILIPENEPFEVHRTTYMTICCVESNPLIIGLRLSAHSLPVVSIGFPPSIDV